MKTFEQFNKNDLKNYFKRYIIDINNNEYSDYSLFNKNIRYLDNNKIKYEIYYKITNNIILTRIYAFAPIVHDMVKLGNINFISPPASDSSYYDTFILNSKNINWQKINKEGIDVILSANKYNL